jgi:hypothetical protein
MGHGTNTENAMQTLNLASPLFSQLRNIDPALIAANYVAQVERLERDVAAAAVATDCGAGGEHGKRHNGMFYHQWVARLDGARESVREIFVEAK